MPKKFKLKRAKYMIPPKLDNNPVWDTVVTSLTPMLSFSNGGKGNGDRIYSVQVSKVSTFNYKTLIEFDEIPEGTGNTTSLLVDVELEDKTMYYWRVIVADQEGNHTDWVVSRFYVDTEYIMLPTHIERLSVQKIETSSSISALCATDVLNMDSYWHSDYGNTEEQWLEFDFGKEKDIRKIWIMTDPNSDKFSGWAIDYLWQKSSDGKEWTTIENTEIKKNKSGRIELDFDDLKSRYLRFVIQKWYGIAAKINDIRFYTPSNLKTPKVPEGDYLLVVNNEQDGKKQIPLNQFLEKEHESLKILNIPFYDISQDFIEGLSKPPKAIILGNNNVDYGKIPIFEYIGVFDVIRYSDIPLLGIGAGLHLQYLAYCPSFVRRIGYKGLNIMELAELRKKHKTFIRLKESPIFIDVINKFTTVETNFWEVVDELSQIIEYENLADYDYPMAVRNKLKEMYGIQFSPEIKTPYNQSVNVLHNFIKLATEE